MKLKDFLFFAAITAMAILAIWITFTTLQAFSGFAAAYGKAVIGMVLFYAFDKIVLNEVDTLHEIVTQKNTSYAIFIFSYAIILAACIATA